MRWIDVFGPPGVGKSSLCDPLWHPHAINWEANDITAPREWVPFLELVSKYLKKLENHPTYEALFRMTRRSIRKMAAVNDDPRHNVYVQTGLAQRGLGIGWRLEDPEEVRQYFELMPTSIGVVALHADPNLVMERNRDRENTPETAHENRQHMVPLMQRPFEIALEVFKEREIPCLKVDTGRVTVDHARKELAKFADHLDKATTPANRAAFRPDYQDALMATFLK